MARLVTTTVEYGEYRLSLRLQVHPSESPAFLAARLVARVLHHRPDLAFDFGAGLCHGRAPVLAVRDPLGGANNLHSWIDVGPTPDPQRLRRAASQASRVVAYCYTDPEQCSRLLAGRRLPRTTVTWLDPAWLALLGHRLLATSLAGPWRLQRTGDDQEGFLEAAGETGTYRRLLPAAPMGAKGAR